jgi:hypothetical protein
MARKNWDDDVLLSEEELAELVRAHQIGPAPSPVPTRMTSNGEFMPLPQTRQQRRVEARVGELSETSAQKLGLSRRRFLQTTGGMAAAFLAMNEVFGPFFKVQAAEVLEPAAYAQSGIPADVFVFDDQLHVVRSDVEIPTPLALRASAQGPSSGWPRNPGNPEDQPDEFGNTWTPYNAAIIGLPVRPENFQLVQFIKDVFLDSQVHVGLLSNIMAGQMPIPGAPTPPRNIQEAMRGEPLTANQGAAVRDFVNDLAGSRRMLAHGMMYVGRANLPWIEYQIENYRPDGWKGYNIVYGAKVDDDPQSPFRSWRHDDEQVTYPTLELISRYQDRLRATQPGFGNICAHKGLAPGRPPEPQNGHPGDYPKAARDWPNLNFIAYHACFQPTWARPAYDVILSGQTREGVLDIPWTTHFAQLAQDLPNVYCDIGAVFAATVVTFPTVTAHMLGQLVKYLGPERVCYGSDAVWHGAPQWQIEALWRFQIPEELRVRYGYPELTEQIKRQILGLNAARLYGVQPTISLYGPVPADYESRIPDELKRTMGMVPGSAGGGDNLARIKQQYQALGPEPSHLRYGWVHPGQEG